MLGHYRYGFQDLRIPFFCSKFVLQNFIINKYEEFNCCVSAFCMLLQCISANEMESALSDVYIPVS